MRRCKLRPCRSIRLVPAGKQQVGGLHGTQPTNSYRFQLVVPFVQTQAVTGAISANILAFNILGVEFIPLPGIDFDGSIPSSAKLTTK
jgi:hypothetical protein